jgi:hypothetical protein
MTPACASSRERNCLVTPVIGSGYSRYASVLSQSPEVDEADRLHVLLAVHHVRDARLHLDLVDAEGQEAG